MEIGDKLGIFEKVVLEDVEDMKKAISSEIWDNSEKELEETRREAEAEYEEFKQKRVNELELSLRLEMSKKQLEEKRELLSYRDQLVNRLIDNCKEKLLNFAKSEKYREYLLSQCRRLSEQHGSENAVFYVKSEDMSLAGAIKNAYGHDCQVQPDETVALGGFKLFIKAQNRLIDESFDTMLADQKEQFIQTSGLSV